MDDVDQLVATRRGWHAVAEQVLAPALHAATGRIGLRAAPGGFTTPPFDGPHGRERLRIDGTELVVERDGGERRAPLTTVRAAAQVAGLEPGAPPDVYPPATPFEPDASLAIDLAAARRLAHVLSAGDAALAQLVERHRDREPAPVQLWPEHLDLATTIAEVNVGVSLGDDEHPLPYLYVGPWTPPPPDGGFWNEPFGASLTVTDPLEPAEAMAFFEDGLRRTLT